MADGHLSEAACLIEQGATYRKRVGLQPTRELAEPIFTGFRPGAFAVYFGDAPIYHFDLEGRWQRAFVEGTHFLKALDGTVQSIDRVRQGPNLVLKRSKLDQAAASTFDLQVRATALKLIDDLDAGKLARIEPASQRATPLPPEELREFLERIARWDAPAWHAHRDRYLATYGPLPFLPPECANAVILQATIGHTGQFGSGSAPSTELYRRPPDEFRQHARDVAELWGRRLLQSRTVFIGGSNVLNQPASDVKSYLASIGQIFSIARAQANDSSRIPPSPPRGEGRGEGPALSDRKPDAALRGEGRGEGPSRGDQMRDAAEAPPHFDGVHVFLDDFARGLHDRPAWNEFAALGLTRVSIGIASGCSELRAPYHQQWTNDALRSTFADLKAAGVGASVLTLVGAGGAEHAEQHVNQTAALIASLDLAPGDFVFLLDENELRRADDLPHGPALDGLAWQQQQSNLKQALAGLKDRKVKVLPYTMEKQGL
jgi:hypothetical protein